MAIRTAADPVAAVLDTERASLNWVARQHSLCADDAEDAAQHAVAQFLERRAAIEPARAGAWLRTVAKHEAMRIRAARQRVLSDSAVAWDDQAAPDPADGEDHVVGRQRVERVAEALATCTADQRRALLLRADGCSYAEIGAVCAWTHTKVNRCLAEGRARFLRRFALIESGSACFAHARRLTAIVDGEASVDDYLAVRPHLRHCGSCRATLRTLYDLGPVREASETGAGDRCVERDAA